MCPGSRGAPDEGAVVGVALEEAPGTLTEDEDALIGVRIVDDGLGATTLLDEVGLFEMGPTTGGV